MSDPDPHLSQGPLPPASQVSERREAKSGSDATRADLKHEIIALREEVAKLNGHRFLQIYACYWRLLVFQLLRGMAFGLGSVLGATVLVSILAYLLSQVDFIPLLAEWAAELEIGLESQREQSGEGNTPVTFPAEESTE